MLNEGNELSAPPTSELASFERLGERMVEGHLSYADLEARLREGSERFSQPQRQALVTGFIRGAVKPDSLLSAQDAYEVAYQVGPIVFNGNFTAEVREPLLRKLAAEAGGYRGERIDGFLKGKKDEAALTRIAELVVERNPKLALDLYCGTDRAGFMRHAIELHGNNPEYRDLIVHCMTALEDTTGLANLARTQLLENHGFAIPILYKHGTTEDLRLIATTLADKSIREAYQAGKRLIAQKEPSAEDLTLFAQLRTRLIQENPHAAEEEFRKWEERGYSKRWVYTDVSGMVDVGRSYLAKGDPLSAAEAFAKAEYDGPEIEQAGLLLLKQKIDPWRLGTESDRSRTTLAQNAMKRAAPTYFRRGGDVTQAHVYLPEDVPDATKRKLGLKLIEASSQSREENAREYRLQAAYGRFMAIGKKSRKDRQALEQLRTQLIDLDKHGFSGSHFARHQDEEGMRLYLKRKAQCHPNQAYEVAQHLGNLEVMQAMRENLIARRELHEAAKTFSEAQDAVGLQLVRERRTPPGIDVSLADYFLGPLEVKADDKRR